MSSKRIIYFFRRLYIILVLAGINPILIFNTIRGIPYFIIDFFKILVNRRSKEFRFQLFPILSDRFDSNGNASGHYFIQDLYVANLIFQNKPINHIDFGSRVDGFVAHVASFRPIEVFDIRPQKSLVKNITFKQVNIIEMGEEYFNYADSMSSLHVFDNIGLGRYSDPIDIEGHNKAFANLHKILKEDGTLYFSVPFGLPQRIEFNAQIIYSLDYLLKLFKGKFTVEKFSYVDDNSNLIEDVILDDDKISSSVGCLFGCAIFVLKKQRTV